jgi:hypothetical protein
MNHFGKLENHPMESGEMEISLDSHIKVKV